MTMQSVKAELAGVRPLLMHNGQLADPTNRFSREIKALISANRKTKTDAYFEDLKRLEWMGGLYRDAQGAIAITEDMLLSSVIGAARASRKGKQFQGGLFGAQAFFRLEYGGPADLAELFAVGSFCDYRLVVVDRKRIMRARPIFPTWSCKVELLYDDDLLNEREVIAALETAGARVGLGDFRPRFGRFTVQIH